MLVTISVVAIIPVFCTLVAVDSLASSPCICPCTAEASTLNEAQLYDYIFSDMKTNKKDWAR